MKAKEFFECMDRDLAVEALTRAFCAGADYASPPGCPTTEDIITAGLTYALDETTAPVSQSMLKILGVRPSTGKDVRDEPRK